MGNENTPEDLYVIPANYTDAGKLLGMFEIRNAVEAVILGGPLIVAAIKLIPNIIAKSILITVIIVVSWILLMGFEGFSTTEFILLRREWKKNRKQIGETEAEGDTDGT